MLENASHANTCLGIVHDACGNTDRINNRTLFMYTLQYNKTDLLRFKNTIVMKKKVLNLLNILLLIVPEN